MHAVHVVTKKKKRNKIRIKIIIIAFFPFFFASTSVASASGVVATSVLSIWIPPYLPGVKSVDPIGAVETQPRPLLSGAKDKI